MKPLVPPKDVQNVHSGALEKHMLTLEKAKQKELHIVPYCEKSSGMMSAEQGCSTLPLRHHEM
ncbi:hypothetical protein V5799_012208, partial [Amblyomma americanum]